MLGLRNEITELRNDINDLKNDIVVSKNELDEPLFEKSKTPVLTPGSKRINPFLRDCEEGKDKGPLVDPLGAIPIENSTSSQSKSEAAQVNGDSMHDHHIGKFCTSHALNRQNKLFI